METKFFEPRSKSLYAYFGVLSTQNSSMGAIDIGFKSFSYYEKTRVEKVLPAKIYTWDKFYDMNRDFE